MAIDEEKLDVTLNPNQQASGSCFRRSDEGTPRYRQVERANKVQTLPGWTPTGEYSVQGKAMYSGQCEGLSCGTSTVVNFRPVLKGNPPLCGACLDSLKVATVGKAEDGYGVGSGGASRGSQRVSSTRFSPYGNIGGNIGVNGCGEGGQVIVMSPAMMGVYRGQREVSPPGSKRSGVPGDWAKSRTWTRGSTSNVPCLFFSEGSCRAGDSCKFLHAV